MKKGVYVLPFMMILSFSFHILVAEMFSLRINAKKSPTIYSWLDILDKNDIYSEKKIASSGKGASFIIRWQSPVIREVAFLKQRSFLSDNYPKKYFSSLLLPQDSPYSFKEERIYPFILRGNYFKKETAYLYLWGRENIFTSPKREGVLYKVLVSPRGKVIFSVPLRLPSDSNRGIQLEEYLRQAVFFFNDNFFWTEVEEVIK